MKKRINGFLMRKRFILIFCITPLVLFSGEEESETSLIMQSPDLQFRNYVMSIYNKSKLTELIDSTIMEYALTGYFLIKKEGLLNKDNILTIIDYTKPSTSKRLFVIDLDNKQTLFVSLVSHGRNSGMIYAKYFSNRPNTMKSCIGFFVTVDTYTGLHGYSLRLRGLEENFNSNAEKRKVVMHGASYVSKEFIEQHGRIGRSWGCPVVPCTLAKNIINKIKGGSCLFIYHNSDGYLKTSSYIDRNKAAVEFSKEK